MKNIIRHYPNPTYIYRLLHIDNLKIYLNCRSLHAPNVVPKNGKEYKSIHCDEIQACRKNTEIKCGPKGTIHDYVPFYFCIRSPMLFKLKTNRVPGYKDGQEPLIYIVSSAQKIDETNTKFVFSDGHGIARYTQWYDQLTDLDKLDWKIISSKDWKDTEADNDRQRRKQAEFLVYQKCDWSLIDCIAVLNQNVSDSVEKILSEYPNSLRKSIEVQPKWYY